MAKKPNKISRILVANRGEIAVRIIRAARESGIESVAVYSDADESALHVRLADRRVALGGSTAKESYLNQEKLIDAAIQTNSDAVHPGYGFLAENASFAAAAEAAGLVFIGPKAEVIRLMGDKDLARKKAVEAGVPVVPGTEAGADLEELKKFSAKIGYPVMIKAVAGGSGRGMRLVEKETDFDELLSQAQAEAESAFKNRAVIVEKCIVRPRHIEIQVFGDHAGSVLHFGERECSMQRRHQKVVEEAPAIRLHPKLREKICKAAVKLAKAVGYTGAGTMEFLVEGGEREDSPFYFLEMNTRIQVEHPVTEAVYGVDLVRLQLGVAAGGELPMSQKDLRPAGHALEFRVYAEDTAKEFRPQTGTIRYISRPAGPGIREDSWVEAGSRISAFYDSLLAKLVVWGATREEAIARARRALDEFVVEGFETTLGFHRWLVRQPAFSEGALDIKWIEREYHGEKVHARSTGPFRLPPLPGAEDAAKRDASE